MRIDFLESFFVSISETEPRGEPHSKGVHGKLRFNLQNVLRLVFGLYYVFRLVFKKKGKIDFPLLRRKEDGASI